MSTTVVRLIFQRTSNNTGSEHGPLDGYQSEPTVRPLKVNANLLHYAMYLRDLRCCKMVVEAGKRNSWSELGSILSPGGDGSSNFKSVLHIAVRKDDVKFLEYFLEQLVRSSQERVLVLVMHPSMHTH